MLQRQQANLDRWPDRRLLRLNIDARHALAPADRSRDRGGGAGTRLTAATLPA